MSINSEQIANDSLSISPDDARDGERAQSTTVLSPLEDLPTLLQLPTDRPRPAKPTFCNATHSFTLPSALCGALATRAAQAGVSPFIILLTAFEALLARFTSQMDFLIGVSSDQEVSSLTAKAIRADLHGDPTVYDLFDRVQEAWYAARSHPAGLADVQAASIGPGASFSPAVSVLFAHSEERLAASVTTWSADMHDLPLDLALELSIAAEQIVGRVAYSAALFDATTIARIAGCYETLLADCVAHPMQRLSTLSLVTEAQRRQVLVEWNSARIAYPPDVCIQQLLEHVAAQQPDHVAVVHEDRQLTYAELNERANQVASYLRTRGVGPDRVVGLYLERSLDLIVSMFGVLKAGGAYVPLDPAYPADRLAFMLSDSNAVVLLTQSRLVDQLPVADCPVICLDHVWAAIAAQPTDNLAPQAQPENLAYIIYTSGSTGTPKGVMISHRSLVCYTRTAGQMWGLTPSDRLLQFISISFDMSVEEIFTCLTWGSTLVLRTDAMLDSVARFVHTCAAWAITVLVLPTAYWHELTLALATEELRLPSSIRYVYFGGDKALAERVALWQAHIDRRVPLVNSYGPTEATVTATMYDLVGDDADLSAWREVPIGPPLPNVQIYVLDPQLVPVPIGVPGELYIGGDQLARGYHRRPDLTADRFVPHPHSDQPGARLYRTGDLVRYLPNGNIEFLGRVDHQVKIRGFRIELGEIEARLSQHPVVRDVIVVAHEAAPGDNRLVAYLVYQPGSAPSASDLRRYLREQLPDYMLPSAFVVLDSLPITPNGKVDRRALPAPNYSALVDDDYQGPQSPTEERLAEIWSGVLQIDRIGIHDNFFALGGHSLLATQVVSRVRAGFNVELPVRALFEAPTIAELAVRLLNNTASDADREAITPQQRPERIPLSFAQQRLWFFDQWAPGNAAYNIPENLRLNGELRIDVLHACLNAVVRRHETLRTTFAAVQGEPVQVIAPTLSIDLPVIDLRSEPAVEREARARHVATKERHTPFDLTRGPLIRATLLRLADTDHILLVTMHHIVTDGWSSGIFSQELTTLYAACLDGQSSPLPALPLQYADFAIWQRGWLQKSVLEEHLAYWRHQLRGSLPVLQLPTDRPRPAVQTMRGGSHTVLIPADLSERLSGFGQQGGSTLYMVLLTAYANLLLRYTGQEDLIIGSPTAGRNRTELETMIGFFVNTLALRIDLRGNPSARDLLGRVRETCLAAYAHQDLPFEKLVEELRPERDPSRPPIFQTLFVLQNAPMSPIALRDLTIQSFEVPNNVVPFDLLMAITPTDDGLLTTFEYNADLFDDTTIERFATHFQRTLETIVDQPNGRVLDLPILTGQEQHQMLVTWNDNASDYPHDRCIHELVEVCAARDSSAPAVVAGAQELTFGELNERANQVAHSLMALGVGPEVRVGICVERSPEMVVGLLGILKAGGAYVPLDPGAPAERLAFMLSDAQVHILLTQAPLVERLPQAGIHLLCLDTDWPAIATSARTNPQSGVTPQHLAYVIYTSGSTGRPKGVEIQHGSMVNRIFWHQRAFSIMPADRASQFFSPAFDVCGWELWPHLCMGASVHIVDDETRVDPHRFLKWVVSHDIAICNLPTSYIDPILDYPWQPTTALRSVRVGGEKLLRRPERELPFGLVNNYGPTENTVTSTWSLVAPGDPSDPLPHIGRPLGNTDVYVLNPRLQPSPIGVPGELYVGGDGLGRGYLRRPELTAERFIPHPFSATPGARLYRTGDLVRYLPDGNLEFVGRVDHQIKIRGLRIELGEIESILGQHPGLREAVVLAREDRPGDRRLVAYIVPEAEVAPSSEELRAFLGAYLPDYMVPAIYITLSALPLTTNDKVDRQALPAPDPRLLDRSQAFVAPRTPLEATIAGVWSEVLGGIAVSVDDNFFALGGHSLLATQVIARLRAALGIEVQVRTLFEAPTVAQLAEYASTAQVMTADLSPITPQPRTEHLALSFAQERLWFLDQFETNSSVYIIAEAFRLTGHLNAAALERALNALVARHEGLRTTFVAESAQPVQVIHPVLYLTLPVVDLSDLAPTERAAEVATRIAEEGRRPFDLSQGPLLRATLLRLSESEHVLLFTMHHIITDGWSMSILYQEWGTLYAVEVAHRSPSLPGLPIQYADYAAWQRAWLQGSVLEEQLAYWRQHLAGPLPILQLPTDRPRPAAQTFNGAALTRTLRPALRDALVALSEREEVTPFMTLFAAFVVLLARSSGQNDVVVGSPIANRRRAEIEGLIGFFVNTLALRVDLRGNPSVRELLGRVRETCLGAYAHQDLPFEKLVEELRPERDPSRAPIFQTLFVLQNAQSVALDLAGLTVQTLDPGREVVGFDLEVYLWDEPDGLRTEINYNTDLFDQATIVRLLDRYEYLLEHFTTGVDRSVAALPLLPPAERQLLLQDWNATALEYPREALLHELISAQAARTPTAIAVTMDEQQMTYRELEELSTNLAQHLLALGVGPDVRVGVYLDRAPILLPILVGILKAGGAYVPLDPAHPRDRLVYIQEDARIKVLITDSVLGSDFPATDFHIFCIDQVDLRQPAGSMPMPATTPANLAYILYTSGSTGRPKGVQVTHSSLINLLWGMREPLEANADDKVVAVTTLSFDIAGMDLYLPLLVGATIILVPRAIAVDGLRLRALIEETDATLMSATPATWRMLLEANWPGSDRLRIACSGEAIPPELARALRPRCAVLWNLYGPTETTIWSTAEQVESFEPPMPIGRPIANTTIYLLDQYLQPVPLGSVGELYIGGDGLARGYWQRPDLTAERFIPDQFSPMPGMRLYRTGDLARYRADGIIEYLGRADHQVKVRGYRIELGEIEAVLEQHTAVRAAVVTPHEQRQGDVRLVAYLIAAAEPVPATQLQQHARTLLPDYMVPASFVWLESFPLTPSGKVDRRALLPPSEQDHPTATFVAPRDAVEEQLVAIWQEVLDVRPIGIHDDFFALGGHSLLAVRLITRIREQFDRQLPLSVLFSSSTVEQLATLMRGPITRQSGTTIVAIQPLGSRRPFYCVHPAGGSVFCYATLSRYVGLDQPFYGIQAPDLSHTPETTIEELAARYVADLLCMQPEGPYQIGGWSVGGVIAFAMAQHLVAQGHEVSRLIILDAWAPNTSNSPVGGTPPDDTTLLTWFIEDLCALAGRESTPDVAFLSATSTSEALRLVLEQCLIADVLPKDIAVDDLYRHLAVFRCTSTAMARYLPQRYPGQIHLLRAGNNEAAEHNDPTMGWYDLAGAGLVTRTIAGTHYTILSEPQVRDVSTQLVDWLEEEQTS